ncbi:MAG: HAMP domain-containing sensor histidine kinase, partial [Nitriliruptoraceae bacterium]
DTAVVVGEVNADQIGAMIAAIRADVSDDVATTLDVRCAAVPVPSSGDDDTLLELSRTNNELVRLHRELAAAHARLDALNDRKNEILAMVAHDLRNPLGSIGGFAQLLERMLGDALEPRALRLLERIGALSDQMIEIVDDLVDVQALERGNIVLDVEDVELGDVVRRTVDTYEVATAAKDLQIAVSCPDDAVHVEGDERRLLQVFDNLVSNAVKYSPAGVGATIRVTCAADRETVTIDVADEGHGIPPDEHTRVFEAFARTSVEPTGGERSTGLGLPITRSIVAAHGGTITFDSAPGQGSTFRVTLPRRQRSDPDARSSP